MNFDLSIINQDGKLVVDSREVARMLDKQHAHLMRDIQGYYQILEKSAETVAVPSQSKFGLAENANESKFGPVDFFIPSTYSDEQGKSRSCYLLTRKGCDMVANKMTGEKGVLFTAAYVTRFDEMEHKLEEERQKSLSPLQMFRLQLEAMEKMEQRQSQQEQRVETLEKQTGRVTQALTGTTTSSGDWQKDMRDRITILSQQSGVYHQFLYKELYDSVEREAHVSLAHRVSAKKKRMKANGAKSVEVNAVSKLNVLADDPKLRLIFESFLHQMEVRYAFQEPVEQNP